MSREQKAAFKQMLEKNMYLSIETLKEEIEEHKSQRVLSSKLSILEFETKLQTLKSKLSEEDFINFYNGL